MTYITSWKAEKRTSKKLIFFPIKRCRFSVIMRKYKTVNQMLDNETLWCTKSVEVFQHVTSNLVFFLISIAPYSIFPLVDSESITASRYRSFKFQLTTIKTMTKYEVATS